MPVQILRHIVYPGTSPHYCAAAPSSDVQSVADEFFLCAYQRAGVPELVLNNGLPVMFFLPGRRCCVRFAGDNGSASRGPGYLAGPIAERTYIHTPVDMQSVFGVRFALCGLYALIGQSVGELRNRQVWSLRDVWGTDADILAEQVAEERSLAGKKEITEEFVRKRMRLCEDNPLFREAAGAINQSRGQVNINALCRLLHINYKWLERQFRMYLGIAPKEYARLQRFAHAFFEAQHAQTADLLDVAVRNGYYDQSHFIREFRRFTGKAPLQYARAGG